MFMAPNKKKKKAAANPARGFATVSIASKPKELEQKKGTVSNEGSKDDGHHEGISPPAANGPAQQSPADGGTAIEDMTPEELEAHLEDSELQSLLDANAARCRSDVIRQVSRLQVERRQLRGQSHKLATREWLEDEALERLLLSCDSYPARHGPISRSVNSNEPKQLLDLWILQRVLLALKLPHLADVMTHIVLLAFSGGVSNDNDMIWGLSEAFDWYALHGSRDELPDYDSDRAHGDPIEEDQSPLPTTGKIDISFSPTLCCIS
jgi:ATP-dependent RNA helicase DHX29